MAFLMRKIKRSYDGVVVEVRDGDTIVADLDLTLDVIKRQRIRLKGYDSPEVKTPNGQRARSFLADLLPRGSKVVVEWDGVSRSFDRIVADVRHGDRDVMLIVVRAGHGLPWDGKGDSPYDASGNPR